MSGGQQSISSADGKFRVVYVESAKPFANYKDNIAWLKEIRAAIGDLPQRHGCTIGFTGEPAFVAEISGSTEWDMKSSGFVTLIVIALIFWLCYRRARPLLDCRRCSSSSSPSRWPSPACSSISSPSSAWAARRS